MLSLLLVFILLLSCAWSPSLVTGQLIEAERREEYLKRGYKWPMEKLVPDTEGWRRLLNRRFHQVEHIQDTNSRYQGWIVSAISAYVQQNFTETGW